MRQREDAWAFAFEFTPAPHSLVDAGAPRQRSPKPSKMVVLGIAADREDCLDPRQMRKQFVMPCRPAFAARRQIGFDLIVTGKAKAHRHDRDLRFIVERVAINAHPLP